MSEVIDKMIKALTDQMIKAESDPMAEKGTPAANGLSDERRIKMLNDQVDWNMEESATMRWTNNVRLRQVIEREGDGYKAIKWALRNVPYPGIFASARSWNRLDLMLEWLVTVPRYRRLFTRDEIRTAVWRLAYEE